MFCIFCRYPAHFFILLFGGNYEAIAALIYMLGTCLELEMVVTCWNADLGLRGQNPQPTNVVGNFPRQFVYKMLPKKRNAASLGFRSSR
jgi:hypothetical protein